MIKKMAHVDESSNDAFRLLVSKTFKRDLMKNYPTHSSYVTINGFLNNNMDDMLNNKIVTGKFQNIKRMVNYE